MEASHTIIKRIIESVDKGEQGVFEKFAGRYRHDTELQSIYELYVKGSDEVKRKLERLFDKRRFSSGGTRLTLKDRRHFKSRRGLEDY